MGCRAGVELGDIGVPFRGQTFKYTDGTIGADSHSFFSKEIVNSLQKAQFFNAKAQSRQDFMYFEPFVMLSGVKLNFLCALASLR